MRCSSCSAETPGGSRFCASCGESLASSSAGTSSDVPTRLSPDSRRPRPSSGSRAGLLSSDSLADARFLPGATVAERYRIIGLLGKGGMGEVYRADDLKLGQPVPSCLDSAAPAAPTSGRSCGWGERRIFWSPAN